MSDRSDYEIQTNTQRISGIYEEKEVGKNGRPFSFDVACDVKVGDYFNAAKSQLLFGDNGGVNGLASAHNNEIRLPNKTTTTGMFVASENNLNFQASTVLPANLNAPTCVASFRVGGHATGVDNWEDNAAACVWHFSGFTIEDGHPINYGGNSGTVAIDGHITINIGGVEKWIALLDKATLQ